MKKNYYASIVMATMVASSATADTVYFKQTDQAGGSTVGIQTLTIEQTGSVANSIGTSLDQSLIEGQWSTVFIRQLESTTVGNEVNLHVYGADSSTEAVLVVDIVGDANTYNLKVGTDGDVTPYVDSIIETGMSGDGNTISGVLASGSGASDRLQLAGNITGNNNSINTTSTAGIGSVKVGYGIYGESNNVGMNMGGTAGIKRVSTEISGSRNSVNFNAQSSGNSEIDFILTGSDGNDTNATMGQIGTNSALNMVIAKNGQGTFLINTTASGSGNNANISLTALGTGMFNLIQESDDTVYNAEHTIAAGGSVDVRQQ